MDRQGLLVVAHRVRILYIIIAAVGAIFVARLFYLQVVRYDHYRTLAVAEHQSKFSIPSKRGAILAQDGEDVTNLVLNQTLPTLYADPQGITDPVGVAQQIASVLDVEVAQLISQLSETQSRYQVLARELSLEEVDAVKALRINGIGFVDEVYRVYPQGRLASQLLGFVNRDNEGQYGIEAALQKELAGSPGRLRAVTDAYGIPLQTIEGNLIEQPKDGEDIVLSIDVNVQRMVERELLKMVRSSDAKSGSVVVMNPNNGRIMAMANYPTYNPEKIDTIKDYGVFLNNVVHGPYETGSGVKVLTMATGLQEGVVTPESTYLDTSSVVVDDVTIENALKEGDVIRSMREVIQRSLNTGAVYILEQLGGGEFNEAGRRTLHRYFADVFGLGSPTGVEQAGESSGVLFGPNEGAGSNVRYANMTFGQGMTVTMMQMTSAVSALVNGGTYYQPTLLQGRIDADGMAISVSPEVVREGVVSKQTASHIRDMMELVVTDGSGRKARRTGYQIGGKTGTAQVPDERGEYSEDATIGSFVGFGGGEKPEYVIMTRIDEPQTLGFAGTEVAAPLFATISNWLIDYYQIPPGR